MLSKLEYLLWYSEDHIKILSVHILSNVSGTQRSWVFLWKPASSPLREYERLFIPPLSYMQKKKYHKKQLWYRSKCHCCFGLGCQSCLSRYFPLKLHKHENCLAGSGQLVSYDVPTVDSLPLKALKQGLEGEVTTTIFICSAELRFWILISSAFLIIVTCL